VVEKVVAKILDDGPINAGQSHVPHIGENVAFKKPGELVAVVAAYAKPPDSLIRGPGPFP
jgi:hypothetical protein